MDRKSKRGRQTIFFTPLNPFGEDSDEEETRDDYTIPQKNALSQQIGNVTRMPLRGQNYPEHQIEDCNFGQTKSHSIIVHNPVPADVIYRVISQNRDRILFERLSTPRPAPKVTLKKQLAIAASTAAASAIYL